MEIVTNSFWARYKKAYRTKYPWKWAMFHSQPPQCFNTVNTICSFPWDDHKARANLPSKPKVSLRASTEPMGRKRLADRRKVRSAFIILLIFLCSAQATLLGRKSILQVVYGDKTFMTGCYRCAISKLPLFHGDSLTSFRARQIAFPNCEQCIARSYEPAAECISPDQFFV